MKVISKRAIADTQLATCLHREIQAQKALHHPHILALYDSFSTSQQYVLITEYAVGGELYSLVSHGRLHESLCNKLFKQLINAVEYAHSCGVVHRDIKPENILLDQNNNVKLADFGLSGVLNEGEALQSFCGSPHYAAPELLMRKPYAGPPVDVWSCGVVLFLMAAGCLPFNQERVADLYAKVKIGLFEIPSHFTSALADLVSRILTVDPVARITCQQIRNHPWFTRESRVYKQLGVSDQSFRSRTYIQQFLMSPAFSKLGVSTDEARASIEADADSLATVSFRMFMTALCYEEPIHSSLPKSKIDVNISECSTLDISLNEETFPTPSNWVYGFRLAAEPMAVFNSIKQHLGPCEANDQRTELTYQHGTQLTLGVKLFCYQSSVVVALQRLSGNTMTCLDLCADLHQMLHKRSLQWK